MIIMNNQTIIFDDSLFTSLRRSFLQYLKTLFKSVSIKKSNLKFYKVGSTKDTYQIPKHQISVKGS